VWTIIAYIGYTLLERSLTRPHNCHFVLYRNTVNLCFTFFFFYLVGFGVAMGAQGGYLGSESIMGNSIKDENSIKWMVLFGMCLISVQIQNSAMNERQHLGAHLVYTLFVSSVIFPLAAAWAWGSGWLKDMNFVDFVGGGVVHMVSGFGGLVATLILGPRMEVISNLNRQQQ
jgi:Amt family ammonium transporter